MRASIDPVWWRRHKLGAVMRWAGKTDQQVPDELLAGVRQFALLPVQMGDGTWVWWEHYYLVLELLPNQRHRFHRSVTLQGARSLIPPRPVGRSTPPLKK